MDKKKKQTIKKNKFLLKKNGNCFISFGQMPQNVSMSPIL